MPSRQVLARTTSTTKYVGAANVKVGLFCIWQYSSKVAFYALPAAGILSLELLSGTTIAGRNPPRFKTPQISQLQVQGEAQKRRFQRPRVLQDLSILVAHMNVLVNPGEADFALFRQAERTLSTLLDILLHRDRNSATSLHTESHIESRNVADDARDRQIHKFPGNDSSLVRSGTHDVDHRHEFAAAPRDTSQTSEQMPVTPPSESSEDTPLAERKIDRHRPAILPAQAYSSSSQPSFPMIMNGIADPGTEALEGTRSVTIRPDFSSSIQWNDGIANNLDLEDPSSFYMNFDMVGTNSAGNGGSISGLGFGPGYGFWANLAEHPLLQ